MIAALLLFSVAFNVLTAGESPALRQKRAFGFGNNFAPAAQGDDAFLCKVCMVFGRLTKNYPDRMSKALDTVCTTMNLGLTCEGGAKAFMGAIRIGGERTACSLVKLCKGALEQGLTAAKNELTKLGTDPAGTIGGALKGTVGSMSVANLAEESAYGAVGFKDGIAAATADPFACTACIWAGKIALNYSEPINKGVDSFCKVVNLGLLCSGGVKLFFVTLKLTGPRAACKMVKMCPGGIFTPVQIPSEMEELASALEGVKNELNEFGDRQLVELEQLHAKFHEGVAGVNYVEITRRETVNFTPMGRQSCIDLD
ncbi:unnamed protein product [Nippostrongylus brasiliensis]|uniref:Saposin B-type domain-containing protein n=1 Tax=Nippostrongylus brasiliensis TaxID=27835 RepID=A0A0N4Y1Y8_NIPBR|nr:unnamed protein product [Nippostrongylus brasiliensis]